MLLHKIRSVRKIYRELEIHADKFTKQSGLACVGSCSACCLYEKIEATILEFLPAAHELYLRGDHLAMLHQLENSDISKCVFHNPFAEEGNCSMYNDRGLICRLFGFSARLDKNSNRALVSCRMMKENADPVRLSASIAKAPVVSAYYMKLYSIDPQLAIIHYPINVSIRKALEYVWFNSQYRRPRKAS
jgi:Fe-S-cluster containining protein